MAIGCRNDDSNNGPRHKCCSNLSRVAISVRQDASPVAGHANGQTRELRQEDTPPVNAPRFVTRDKRGCFLGMFTVDEARGLWKDARKDKSVILVPYTVEFADAAASISHTADQHTPFMMQQRRKSIEAASKLPELLIRRRAAEFWKSLANVKLEVRHTSPKVIARLLPSDLDRAFGNEWFLVSQTEAQIVAEGSYRTIVSRAKEVERWVNPSRKIVGTATVEPKPTVSDDDAQDARKSMRRQQAKELAAARAQAYESQARQDTELRRNRLFFRVIGKDGTTLYSCKRSESARVLRYLRWLLPIYAYKLIDENMRLTWDLEALGFKSARQFGSTCSEAANGKEPSSDYETPSSELSWFALIEEAKLHSEDMNAVSFDGPEHTLQIFGQYYYCNRAGHKVERVRGEVVTLGGNLVNIMVNHCKECRRYYVSQREYDYCLYEYGPVLGNFSFIGCETNNDYGYDYYDFESLSPYSLLNLCGYNVSEREGLSSYARQLILANVMDRGIIDKASLMGFLEWLIRTRRNNPNMGIACSKWEEDLSWVSRYNVDRNRRFASGNA